MQSQATTGKTLGLVVRVSRVGKREGERFQSPGDQIAIGTARAEREGYAVRVFEEDAENGGVSGATPYDERPGMSKALKLVEAGQLDGIVVSALDRLVREDAENGVTLKSFQKRIRKAGGVLLVADNAMAEILDPDDEELEGNEEWATEAPNMANAIYRREMRKRWRRARGNAVARGAYVGPAPAGYERGPDGKLVPGVHADAVREAFALRAKGASWSTVARRLSEAEVPTSRGSTTWSFKGAAKLCENVAYLGVARSGKFRNEEAHEPLVDERLWRRVQTRRESRGASRKQEKVILAGVLRCASCGHALTRDYTMRAGRRFDFYRCRNAGACSGRVTIGADMTERYVGEWMVDRIQVRVHHPPKHGKKGTTQADLEAALTKAEAELETYVTVTSAADIGAALFRKGLDERKQVRDAAAQALQEVEDRSEAFAGLPPEILTGVRGERTARNVWGAAPVMIKNRWLRLMFPKGIPVSKGRGVEEKIGALDTFEREEEAAA